MDALAKRGESRPSGGVNWVAFLACAALTLIISMGLAVGLHLLYLAGWYSYVITPGLVAIPLAIVANHAVKLGQCCNRAAAVTLGLAAGLALYLGQFHVHFVSLAGPEFLGRIDMLPQFVIQRMNTDQVVTDSGTLAVSPLYKWLAFGLDAFIVLLATTIGALGPVSKAFCESCRCWMKTKAAILRPASALCVERAVVGEYLHQLPDVPQVVGKNEVGSIVRVDYCHSQGPLPCRAYVSTANLTRVEISPDELQTLLEKCPALK